VAPSTPALAALWLAGWLADREHVCMLMLALVAGVRGVRGVLTTATQGGWARAFGADRNGDDDHHDRDLHHLRAGLVDRLRGAR
jgi:hypothetical protein